MHYTRIVEGIAFVSKVIIGHYKIYITSHRWEIIRFLSSEGFLSTSVIIFSLDWGHFVT